MTLRFAIMVGVASAALTACTQERPAVQIRTVEVPSPQPCMAADDIPAEPATVGDRLTGNAGEDLIVVAESALLLRSWGGKLHSAMVACAGE